MMGNNLLGIISSLLSEGKPLIGDAVSSGVLLLGLHGGLCWWSLLGLIVPKCTFSKLYPSSLCVENGSHAELCVELKIIIIKGAEVGDSGEYRLYDDGYLNID